MRAGPSATEHDCTGLRLTVDLLAVFFLFVDFDFMVFCKEILERENIDDEKFEIDYFLVTI